MQSEIIYGRQPVLELLRAGRREILRIAMFDRVRPSDPIKQIRKLTAGRKINLDLVDHSVLDRLVGGGNHQGVVAVTGPYPYADLADITASLHHNSPLFLLLDHIQDPQNLGAILRSADAVGVDAVVLPNSRAAQVTPAVVRVSAGATEHLPICLAGNLHRTMLDLKKLDFTLAGLEMEPQAIPYNEADLRGPTGLVIGSEGQGIGKLIRDTCDVLIKIPMRGRINSLNAAAATAVALYEILRQRSS